MLETLAGLAAVAAGVVAIVWGAETFAEHLGVASARLGVSTFAIALLLAGAEPEELATAIAASVRGAPAIAFGDVVGANVAACLVAVGVAATVASVPFGASIRRYALLGLPAGVLAAALAWDGRVGRPEAGVLVGAYVAYVVVIWVVERRPPVLGEVGEAAEAAERTGATGRVGRELVLVVAGVAVMAVGATLLVAGVEGVTHVEASQTRLGLTVVGFATAFELVVLAWSAGRRGQGEAAVAGVIGSFAYNATMTLGGGALAGPLRVRDAGALHLPLVLMVTALALVVVLGAAGGRLGRRDAAVLLAAYPVFVVVVLVV